MAGLAPEKQQSIARAAWRIDGLASLQAKKKQSRGSSKPMSLSLKESKLLVNADVENGSLIVEVLDAAGQVIEGYEKESCVIENQDSVKLAIRWKNADALPAGIPIRLRFHLENGDLYSYLID